MSEQTKIDDGGNAFPLNGPEDRTYAPNNGIGMSLRDYFAAKAMAAYLSSDSELGEDARRNPAKAARWAYEDADEMLKARRGGAA